jgi:hypothetical protein
LPRHSIRVNNNTRFSRLRKKNEDHRLLMDFVSSPRAHLMHALGYASAPFLEPDRSTNQKENIRVSSCVIDPPRPPPVAVVWQHKLEIVNATVQ